MTTAQLEHLRLIDAHLDRLLETAVKRTPGEWDSRFPEVVHHTETDLIIAPMADAFPNRKLYNAAFIASCAGNAEAGWRSTKFAIAGLQSVINMTEDPSIRLCAEAGIKTILAEWPLELINKQQ